MCINSNQKFIFKYLISIKKRRPKSSSKIRLKVKNLMAFLAEILL